jgi:hypothetical protein
MVRRHHRISGIGGSWIGPALGAAFVLGAQAEAVPLNERECVRPALSRGVSALDQQSDYELEQTAAACERAVLTARGVGQPLAYLRSGMANLQLGAMRRNEALLRRAIDQLQAAASSFPTFGRSYLGHAEAAQIGLARAHRLLGDTTRAEEILAAIPGNSFAVALERARTRPNTQSGRETTFADLLLFSRSYNNLSNEEARIVGDGRAELITVALALGTAAMAEPSRQNADRALRFYGAAGDAALASGGQVANAPDIFVALGEAHLWAAGLNGTNGFDCTYDRDYTDASLYSARAAFEQALALDANSADANWGKGCAIAAGAANRAQLEEAVGYLRRGASGGRPRNLLTLARAEAAAGSLSEARRRFGEALSSLGGPERSQVRVEIAQTYLRESPPNVQAALSELNNAVAEDQNSQEARLARGQVRYMLGDPGAVDDLRIALRGDAPNQARANFILSRILTSDWRNRSRAEAEEAVNRATLAYDGDRDNNNYRLQACVSRIVFRLTENGRAFCEAQEARDNYALALVYEGVFYLREAYRQSGVGHQDNLARALGAFQRGRDWLRSNPNPVIENGVTARELMEYGERVALYCGGLGGADPLPPTPGPRQFFVGLGYDRCRPGR